MLAKSGSFAPDVGAGASSGVAEVEEVLGQAVGDGQWACGQRWKGFWSDAVREFARCVTRLPEDFCAKTAEVEYSKT